MQGQESGWRNMEVCKESKIAALLGKGVEGVSDRVMEESKCDMYWILKWWLRKMLYGNQIDRFWSPSLHPLQKK